MLFSAMEGSWRRAPALGSVWFVSLCRLFLCDWSTNWLTNQSMQMWKCAGQIQGHVVWCKLDDDRSFSSLSAAAFDKKYKAACTRLSSTLGREELRKKRAQPPSPKAIDCRRSFHPPLECWWSRKQTSLTTAASGVRPSEGEEERRHTQDPCCLHLLVFFTSLLPPGGCRSDALLPVLCSSVCLVDVNPAAPRLH